VAIGQGEELGISHVGEQVVPMVVSPKPGLVFPPISTNYVQIHCGKHVGSIEDPQQVIPGREEVLTWGGMGGHVVEEQPPLEEAGLPCN
jgi:hypothetical protein